MKKIYATIIVIVFFTININGQDATKDAIIIDGIQVDSIPCWGFDKMDVLFPVNKTKWKNYDMIEVVVLYESSTTDKEQTTFRFKFMPNQLDEYFSDDVKYGVWHFLAGNKEVYTKSSASYNGVIGYTKETFWDYSVEGARMWVEVYGATLNGDSHYDRFGKKIMSYNYVSLYKSKYTPIRGRKKSFKAAFTKSKSAAETCNMPGQKFTMKITAAGGNLDNLEVIK